MPTGEQLEIPLQEINGTLEAFLYQNEENGYCVARFSVKGQPGPVTAVGGLAAIQSGETACLRGRWVNHSQYGRQFEVSYYTILQPATLEAIRKYLGSGLIRGMGPSMAGRIVEKFGLQTLEVIENQPQRLKEVYGIGRKRTAFIAQAWQEQKQIKEIMLFLQSNGISAGLAIKIYKQYGDQAIEIVRRDPYRLARDIYGIGFKTADKIARQMGLAPDAKPRLQAGLRFALEELSGEGHCFALRAGLLTAASQLLSVNPEAIAAPLDELLLNGDLRAEDEAIYLPAMLAAEQNIAARLCLMKISGQDRLEAFRHLDWPAAFDWLDQQSHLVLTAQQKSAIRTALTEKVSILTGGPGTGKTTITRSLIQLLKSRGGSVLLAAPTGRAAKRLSEATGLEAKTIHRLLEFNPSAGQQFNRDADHPLDADLILIDETSMIDVYLMNSLLEAIPSASHLLLVGDMDQLPSVGPGNVLRDLIHSQALPVARLDTIFRQAEDSFIITNAHRINQGHMPEFSTNSRDFYLFSESDAQKAADRVIDLVSARIPGKFGFNPREDIQVLSPMHRGAAGVTELNQRLQQVLNPHTVGKVQLPHGSRILREGDRVMQLRNDYERLVFNGDLGRITQIDLEMHVVQVEIDGRPVPYEYAQLDELTHAYAVSIHKAQGCEFPVAVIPLVTQHYRMLQRNLLYTAVTRARKLVVLVGDRRAIGMAVRNDRIAERNTRLAARLSA